MSPRRRVAGKAPRTVSSHFRSRPAQSSTDAGAKYRCGSRAQQQEQQEQQQKQEQQQQEEERARHRAETPSSKAEFVTERSGGCLAAWHESERASDLGSAPLRSLAPPNNNNNNTCRAGE
ncbi:unnamed protein product [Lampetra planeri]